MSETRREFISPVLSGFKVVPVGRHKPPVISGLVRTSAGSDPLTLTNPKELQTHNMSPSDMSPSDIAKEMNGEWEMLCIFTKMTHESVSYRLELLNEDGKTFSVRAKECTDESVT